MDVEREGVGFMVDKYGLDIKVLGRIVFGVTGLGYWTVVVVMKCHCRLPFTLSL